MANIAARASLLIFLMSGVAFADQDFEEGPVAEEDDLDEVFENVPPDSPPADDPGTDDATDESLYLDDTVVEGTGGWPPILLKTGQLILWGHLQVALNDELGGFGGPFEPVSIAPDAWYGYNDEITLGFVHSSYGLVGFWGGQGDGICFTGQSGGCVSGYQSLGFLGRYFWKQDGPLQVVFDGGVVIRRTDPFVLSLKGGLVARYEISPRMFAEGAASLLLGITERKSFTNGGANNKERIYVPVSLHYLLENKMTVFGQSGLTTQLEDLGDLLIVPLTIGATYPINEDFSAVGSFSLPALIGGDGVPQTGFEARTLTLSILYRRGG